jgi:hypothetical protein
MMKYCISFPLTFIQFIHANVSFVRTQPYVAKRLVRSTRKEITFKWGIVENVYKFAKLEIGQARVWTATLLHLKSNCNEYHVCPNYHVIA